MWSDTLLKKMVGPKCCALGFGNMLCKPMCPRNVLYIYFCIGFVCLWKNFFIFMYCWIFDFFFWSRLYSFNKKTYWLHWILTSFCLLVFFSEQKQRRAYLFSRYSQQRVWNTAICENQEKSSLGEAVRTILVSTSARASTSGRRFKVYQSEWEPPGVPCNIHKLLKSG